MWDSLSRPLKVALIGAPLTIGGLAGGWIGWHSHAGTFTQPPRLPVAFTLALLRVMEHEGGYANVADDHGGETKWGISKRAYPHLNIKSLSYEQAEQIYYTDYWVPHDLSSIKDVEVAAKLMDIMVQFGAQGGKRIWASALKEVEEAQGFKDQCGDVCVTNKINDDVFVNALTRAMTKKYLQIVQSQPKQKKFIKGWLARANDKTYLGDGISQLKPNRQ